MKRAIRNTESHREPKIVPDGSKNPKKSRKTINHISLYVSSIIFNPKPKPE
jgi:hypothetical protein